eukprot:1138848-Pelagomonas_calceolata.AAC.15
MQGLVSTNTGGSDRTICPKPQHPFSLKQDVNWGRERPSAVPGWHPVLATLLTASFNHVLHSQTSTVGALTSNPYLCSARG